jgi:surfeit locus 1 family protein
MTARRIPIFSTIVVIAAVLTMIGLGIWQLQRKQEKEALIALYSRSAGNGAVVDNWYSDPFTADPSFAYRRVAGDCMPIGDPQLVSGRSASGQSGLVAAVPCRILSGFDLAGSYVLVLGWTDSVEKMRWNGGKFAGTLVPTTKMNVMQPEESGKGYDRFVHAEYHIVADPPLAGLEPMAKPDPGDLPNNHLAYAGQWFFFALTALVIYVLALQRKRR